VPVVTCVPLVEEPEVWPPPDVIVVPTSAGEHAAAAITQVATMKFDADVRFGMSLRA
jgi:hypothetical protein